MTSQEYQTKYGTSPASSTAPAAPVKMTRDQYNATFGSKIQNNQLLAPQERTTMGDGLKSGAIGFAKGAGKVGLGIGTLGRSIQEGVSRATGGGDLPEDSIFDMGSEKRAKVDALLAPNNRGESVSSFVSEVGSSMIPSTAAYKTTRGLGFLTKMLGRGTSGAVTGTVQGGGDIDSDTALGVAAETILPGIASTASKYGGNVLKSLAGFVSGKGGDVIEQVLKSPRAALEGAEGVSSQVLKDTAASIRSGVKTIRENAGKTFEGLTKNHTEPLDRKAFDKLTSEFFDEVDSSTFLRPENINKLKNTITEWTDNSPQGLNKLASKISKFYSGSDAGKDMDSVVSGLNRTIRNWIGGQVPDIAEANARYSDKMDLIEQMEGIFKTKGAIDGRVGLQKTSEAVGRLFNASKDIAREGVEEIEKELGINVLGKEAGRQLVGNASTKFQAGASGVVEGLGRALLPPKALLQITARTGIAKNAIEAQLDTLAPAVRSSVIEVLTNLFGEGVPEIPEQSNIPRNLQ